MITLLGKRKQRVIDILRMKYPNQKWVYNHYCGYWYGDNGYANWRSTCTCDDTCSHRPDLYYYPYLGDKEEICQKMPELVMHGFWEITR